MMATVGRADVLLRAVADEALAVLDDALSA